MGQLSQFDPVATMDGGVLTVSGPVAPERDENGREVQRHEPIFFFFTILKDGRTLTGFTHSIADVWTGELQVGQLEPGSALALGLTVEVRKGDVPTYETVSWAQPIEIQLLVPSDAKL